MPRQELGKITPRQRASFLEEIEESGGMSEGLRVLKFGKQTHLIVKGTISREGGYFTLPRTYATVGKTVIWHEQYDPQNPSREHRAIGIIYDRITQSAAQ